MTPAGRGHRILIAVAMVAAASLPALGENLPSQPNDAITPGTVGSTDFSDVCGRIDGRTYSQRHRNTTQKMKNNAYAAYQIEKAGRDFEVDHRVPLCAGGADDSKNLWPQRGWMHPSFHDKDLLEALVCRAVCRTRTMTVAQGQAIFLGDWVAGFKRVFGRPPLYAKRDRGLSHRR